MDYISVIWGPHGLLLAEGERTIARIDSNAVPTNSLYDFQHISHRPSHRPTHRPSHQHVYQHYFRQICMLGMMRASVLQFLHVHSEHDPA